jgi:primosomal protein N' (replication factor Y)
LAKALAPFTMPAMGLGAARYAEVAVNSPIPARRPYTYRIPPGMRVLPGQPVFVPFGSQVLQGVVLRTADEPSVGGAEIKEITAPAEPEPLLDAAHIALAEWLTEEYLAPLWDAVAVCLPPGYSQTPVTMVTARNVPALYPGDASERRILQFVSSRGQVSLAELRQAVPEATEARLRSLQERGLLSVATGLRLPGGRPKFERRVRLTVDSAAARREAGQRRGVEARVLAALADAGGELPLSEVRALGAERAHLQRLASAGLLEETAVRVWRQPAVPEGSEPLSAVLSPAQQAAFETIVSAPGRYLLHGVTGSGKTEVYLRLAERALADGGGVIVLVPEISLTPQVIERFGRHFGRSLAVFHSQLSLGERFDQWFRVRAGAARLVVGSRSAVFAPVPNLRLIIVDEEHEPSFKQSEPPPRYHAREVARFLAERTGATLVLGSATPDVCTYHAARRGEYRLVELGERLAPGEAGPVPLPLPEVTVVDMRAELAAGNRSVFSRALQEAIRGALDSGEQVILFTNRLGLARFLLCRDCGFVPQCPSCRVAMALMAEESGALRLRCTHCGRRTRVPLLCPSCGGPRCRPFGVGTQRIEREARATFPNARVARWDSDTARRKGAHERLLQQMTSGELDILVGTQVLAKGLDLPAVSVVGVVDADVALNLPVYTAHERTYQLIEQVAGRAGRRFARGQVFVQTYQPEAPPIQAAAAHDYLAFYEHEVAHRRTAGYPPFARLVRLEFRHANRERGLRHAIAVANELRLRRDAAGHTEPEILGPSPAYVHRWRGLYRWTILLRGRDPASLLRDVPLGTAWSVDVDPVSLV